MFKINNDFEFILDQVGRDILINGTHARAVISNSKTNLDYDDRYLSTIGKIKRGDVINYDGEWLVVSEVGGQRYGKYKGIIRKCNYKVKFNFDGIIKEFPCIIDGKGFNMRYDWGILLPAGTIILTLQDTPDTSKIELNQRLIKMGFAWEVKGIDKSKAGLSVLTCEIAGFVASDDKENEIPDVGDYLYSLEILNKNINTVYLDNTLQLKTQVKINNSIVNDMEIVFTSSDNNIATVDKNGLVTGISEGTAIITAQSVNVPKLFDTITLDVKDQSQVDEVVINILGADSITRGGTETYTVKIYNNGVQVFDQTVTWSLNNTNGIITSQDGTSCQVTTGDKTNVYTILRATLDSDDNIFDEKEILMKGYW